MLLDRESLCLKQEFITEFYDSIITASHLAIQQSIPYSHQSKVKVVSCWDIDNGHDVICRYRDLSVRVVLTSVVTPIL